MKVTCSRCGTEYNFDDSKVTEEGVKVKCTRCDNVFRVRKKAYAITEPVQGGGGAAGQLAAGTEETSAPTYTGATSRQWMIRRESGETMEFKEMTTLQRWIVERRVIAADEISHNGVKWKRLGAIPELAPFFKVVEDEDAASGEQTRLGGPGDPRVSTGEFMIAQKGEPKEEEDRTQRVVTKNGNGSAASAKPASALDAAWGDDRQTSRSDAVKEAERRDAERATHDPTTDERKSKGGAATPPRRSRAPVIMLGLVAVLGGAFYWAQFTEGGLVATAPVRAKLLAMLGAAPAAATPTPEATPTAVADVSATPVETTTPAITATPEATPPATEVAVSTPVAPTATPTPAPTKVAVRPSVDKLLQQGFEAYSRGRYREAITKYQGAVNADPDNSEAYALLGLAYLDSGNDDLAESSLEAAIRLNPRFADAHRYLGMLYARRGDKPRAIASFNEYLSLRPNGPTSDDVRRRVATLQGG